MLAQVNLHICNMTENKANYEVSSLTLLYLSDVYLTPVVMCLKATVLLKVTVVILLHFKM